MEFVQLLLLAVVMMASLVVQATTLKAPNHCKSMKHLARRIELGRRLQDELEDQMRRATVTEHRVQDMLAQPKGMKQARKKLEKEVLELEADAARHQEMVDQAPARASKVAQDARGKLEQVLTVMQEEKRKVDEANRRLCEALTEHHGTLQVLCRGATMDPSPDLAKVMHWLGNEANRNKRQGKKGANRTLIAILKLAAVWSVGLALVKVVMRGRKKTAKLD